VFECLVKKVKAQNQHKQDHESYVQFSLISKPTHLPTYPFVMCIVCVSLAILKYNTVLPSFQDKVCRWFICSAISGFAVYYALHVMIHHLGLLRASEIFKAF
jgi:hypothetical protein